MGKSRKAKSQKGKKARREGGRVCSSRSPVEATLSHIVQANPPKFLYSNAEILKRRDAVGINDIRDLVLHLVADAPPPSWIRVQNPQSIQKVVVLLVPGLTHTVLSLPPLPTSATENPNIPISIPLPVECPSTPATLPDSVDPRSEEAAAEYGGVPFVSRTFSHACPTRAPGDSTRMHSVLNTFFQTPVSGEEKKRRIQERVAAERVANKDPAQYVLTLEQMVDNDYPVPSYLADVFEKPKGWVETPQATPDSEPGEQAIYAVDCEMCLTEDGKALARVCVIEYATDKVVYDQLVKPPSPITDYLTQFSGITAEALEGVTTTLADVQARLQQLLTSHTILLGHSLESDLRALRLSHPRAIDTALLYHHPRGRPLKPGLAWLTRKWLGRTIQARGPGGHDPEEDARACADLLRAKIKHGPGYGEFKTDYEPTLARIARAPRAPRAAVVDHGNPAAWHGAGGATAISCLNDAEVLSGVLDTLPTHSLVFARFTELADALGWITPKVNDDGDGDASTSAAATGQKEADGEGGPVRGALTALDARLAELHAALPPRAALLVFSGHSDPRAMSALASRRAETQSGNGGLGAGWTTVDERALEEAVVRARRGLLFVGVKT
ncbi:ribonuclease H-like protein [Gloeopeniophorella convolvens]|nr:ribonuclease H-like protein [Gloeopeniophorella convolvens]